MMMMFNYTVYAVWIVHVYMKIQYVHVCIVCQFSG